MCVIEGCDTKPVAKGLCAKHNMRQRRTGDPNRVRKPGRKRNPVLELLTENRSRRSNMRFVLAARWLREAGADDDALRQAIKTASRPNGTLNISRLLGIAARAWWKRLVENAERPVPSRKPLLGPPGARPGQICPRISGVASIYRAMARRACPTFAGRRSPSCAIPAAVAGATTWSGSWRSMATPS
jgi:hypothetical protein